MSTTELTDSAYSLLRFYLREYDGLKDKRPSEKRENPKKVPTLFVPPVASCARFKRVRGYRLCWNIGAVEIYRNGLGSSKNNVSSAFLQKLPSFSAFSKSWANALNALERLQERKLPMKSELKFRVTVLGLPRSSCGSPAVPETCTTQFVATWLGQGIREAFGWKVDLENYDVEVVATLLTNETVARQVGVLSLGLTLCRATTSECLAGLLANQRSDSGVFDPLKCRENLKAIHGNVIINQMLSIANELNEPRASWCLVRRAIKSVYFRRKLLNVANKRGETPMILAAKACDSRLVSLILALGKRKLKESKIQPHLQHPHPMHAAEDPGDRRFVPIRGDLMKRDNQQYDALMHSCERGDNSTVSVLLNHKSGTFNWGFNKLCERCLSVAASASQHHTLTLVLIHLFNGKGSRVHPSLCWPALQASIEAGNSLTVALILDYMRMFASRCRAKEEERMNSRSRAPTIQIPQNVVAGLQSQSVFDLLCRANVFVLRGDRSMDMKSAFPLGGVCSTSTISSTISSATLTAPKLSSTSSVSLLTCLLKEKSNQNLHSPSLPISIKKGKEIKKEDDKKLSCGPPTPSMLRIEVIGDERSSSKKCRKEKKDLNENFHDKGVMTEYDGKGGEGGNGLDDMDEITLDSPTQMSKSKISKPKKLRIVGGRSSGSHLKFYENEKKLWLSQLLDDTQLCSSILQLILTYIVV